MILEYLKDDKALFAALQVNKLWADEATTLLWRTYPEILDLARIEDFERLQYYANKISVLSIQLNDDEHEGHRKLQNVQFLRLKHLSMSVCDGKKEQMFLQYLQPHLQTICVYDGPVSSYYLTQIQALCPALRNLSLCDLSGTVTADDLLDFLNGMLSLADIHLWGGLKDVVSDEVFLHLASRPDLARLATGDDNILTRSLIKRLPEVVDQPFPKLDYLLCFVESSAFSQLSSHLNGLTELHLHLVDAASKTTFDICSCTNLVSLSLCIRGPHFDTKSHFPPEGLLALAKSCSHLQSFSVTAGHVFEADSSGIANIDDDVIGQFVALLPGLTCFEFGINSKLTERAFRLLGEGCAGLKNCSLDGSSFDLHLLGSGSPVLFPQLEWLELDPIHVEDDLAAATIAEILHHHAPRVKDLRLGGPARRGGELRLIDKVGMKMREFGRQGEILYFVQL